MLALLTTQINQELPDFRRLKPLKLLTLNETPAKMWGAQPARWSKHAPFSRARKKNGDYREISTGRD
jgi:hypothetical protein